MTCEVCRNGDLTTITAATSGFTADFTSIGGNSVSREVIDSTTLGLQTCREKCPGDKIDWGEVTAEFCFDPDVQPPYSGDTELWTITFPPSPSQTNGATFAFYGFVSNWTLPTAAPDERMTSTITITIACSPAEPVFTPGS